MADEYMKNIFTNPMTGKFYQEGDIIRRQQLAHTLEALANASDPTKLFYQGESLNRRNAMYSFLNQMLI